MHRDGEGKGHEELGEGSHKDGDAEQGTGETYIHGAAAETKRAGRHERGGRGVSTDRRAPFLKVEEGPPPKKPADPEQDKAKKVIR